MKRTGPSLESFRTWAACRVLLSLGLCCAAVVAVGQEAPVPEPTEVPPEAPAKADDTVVLPSEYKPPRNPDPMLLIVKELVPKFDGSGPSAKVIPNGSVDGLTWYKKNRAAFQRAMNAGDMVGQNRVLVQNGLKVLVLRLSLQANRPVLTDVRKEIERWMDRAASLSAPNARRPFRQFVMDNVIENCELLLDNQLEVRMSAVILLNNAYVEVPNANRREREKEFYAPTYTTFTKILEDQNQHVVVRIWAAKGLRRVLSEAEVRNQQRDQIARTLMGQLLPGKNDPWLDMRIAEAAGYVGIVKFAGGKPVVADGLAKVLNDAGRDPLVRSESAKQLARIVPDESYNLTLFAHQTVRLVKEMAAAQAKQPKSAKWRVCFLNVYLAFVPEDKEAANAESGLLVRAKGNLKHGEYVPKAFQEVLPFVSHALGKNWQAPFPAQQIGGLDAWLKTNPPKDWRPTPACEPLEVQRVAEKGPAGEPAG